MIFLVLLCGSPGENCIQLWCGMTWTRVNPNHKETYAWQKVKQLPIFLFKINNVLTLVICKMILTYTYGGINRSFSGRLRLSVTFDYPANGNRSLSRIIEVLLYYTLHTHTPKYHTSCRTPSYYELIRLELGVSQPSHYLRYQDSIWIDWTRLKFVWPQAKVECFIHRVPTSLTKLRFCNCRRTLCCVQV
jgi:hypothetical protein